MQTLHSSIDATQETDSLCTHHQYLTSLNFDTPAIVASVMMLMVPTAESAIEEVSPNFSILKSATDSKISVTSSSWVEHQC